MSISTIIHQDIAFLICSFYKYNKDILHFLSLTKYLHTLKHYYTFDKECVPFSHIKDVSYKDNIKHLFLDSFLELDSLSHITHITLSENFNKIKRGFFPSSVKKITFGYWYTWPLEEGILPYGLEKVVFGNRFDHEINKGVLPNTLKTIRLFWILEPTLDYTLSVFQ